MAALDPVSDGSMTLLVRDDEESDWRPLHEVGPDDALSLTPLAFDASGRRLLTITSAGANAARLVWLDCATGEATVVAEDATYDVAGARLHPDTNEPQIVFFVKDRMDYLVLDSALADDVAMLRGSSPAIWAS